MVVALLSVQHINKSPVLTPLLLTLENISYFLDTILQQSHRNSSLAFSVAIQSHSEFMPLPVTDTMEPNSTKVGDARAQRLAEYNAKLVR